MRRYAGAQNERIDQQRFRLIHPDRAVRSLAPEKHPITADSRSIRSFSRQSVRADAFPLGARSLFYHVTGGWSSRGARSFRRVRVGTGNAETPTRREPNKMSFSDLIPRTYAEQF